MSFYGRSLPNMRECGTSQVEEAPACSTQGAAAACDAMPRATVAFDGEGIRAARHSFAGQAPPLSATRGRCWANQSVCGATTTLRRCRLPKKRLGSQTSWLETWRERSRACGGMRDAACRAAVAEPSRVRSSGLATPPQKQSPHPPRRVTFPTSAAAIQRAPAPA